MDQRQRDQLGAALIKTAIMYGAELPRERVVLFIQTLIEFIPARFDDYMKGLSRYCLDVKNRTMPTPATLRPYITGDVTTDDESKEVASRVIHAVSKFGWNRGEDAKSYIGEVGWHCVQRFGGWQFICENLGVDFQLTTFQAQMRDLVKSTIELNRAGYFERNGLQLGTTNVPQIQNVIKQLAQAKTIPLEEPNGNTAIHKEPN